ncbi:MAG: cobalt-precorrin hydrolase / cobalt-factor methyltransferase / precorrin-3B [Actinomycetota bacterium]|nr:cobalt-precorrin hydrolase / cobalt-factor methyltransferase / precorrin-3B [Actinomycetota bacterium]
MTGSPLAGSPLAGSPLAGSPHPDGARPGPVPTSVALVATTSAGRRAARRLEEAWPAARLIDVGNVAESLRRAFAGHEAVVAFAATGIVVRVLGPLLRDKHTDPAVVVCDEAGRHAIALVGGHAGGANDLAARVAAVLGGDPVVTTATDVAGLPGLDTLGWPVEGALAAVTRAVLDGEPVRLELDPRCGTWPLPALPGNVIRPDGDLPVPEAGRIDVHGEVPGDGTPAAGETPRYRILVTDRLVEEDPSTVVLRPPSLVAGAGASRGVDVEEVASLLDRVLREAGLSPASLHHLATADVKADEPGIVALAGRLGIPLVTRSAAVLADVVVPNPSAVVDAAVGTPSVAEAAAALDGDLVVPKHASPMATVAVARLAPRGRLALVGLGPGARDQLTPLAVDQLRASSVVVGLDQYVDQVRDLLRPGTRILITGMGQEEQRARSAVVAARAGHAVALVGSGDSGVYAMASPALEEADDSIDVLGVPGVTAGLAASAVLGAPLGNDHAYISLSDLHTPWPTIVRRVQAAAEGDFVVLFYNPRSRGRHWQLGHALGQLAGHRPPSTPVGVVRNASRPDETWSLTTLAGFDPAVVDMYSLVVVGSTQTRIVAGRMVTPRGFRWREKQEITR